MPSDLYTSYVRNKFGSIVHYRVWNGRALWLLSINNPFRRLCIHYFTINATFDFFMIIVILTNCVFLALDDAYFEAEVVFQSIYTVEMLGKIVGRGFLLHRYAYLRDPWNWLDFVVVCLGYLGFIPSIGNYSAIKTIRVFRALRTITAIPGLRLMVNSLARALKALGNVMLLVTFTVFLFAIVANQLYVGVLLQKCVQLPTNWPNASLPYYTRGGDYNSSEDAAAGVIWNAFVQNQSNWLPGETEGGQVCGNGSGTMQCPEPYTCLPGIGSNPNFGFTNYDNFAWALIVTIQVVTLDFWEDVYMLVLSTAGTANIIYFVFTLFFGALFVFNLVLAVVAMSYAETNDEEIKEAAANEGSGSVASAGVGEGAIDADGVSGDTDSLAGLEGQGGGGTFIEGNVGIGMIIDGGSSHKHSHSHHHHQHNIPDHNRHHSLALDDSFHHSESWISDAHADSNHLSGSNSNGKYSGGNGVTAGRASSAVTLVAAAGKEKAPPRSCWRRFRAFNLLVSEHKWFSLVVVMTIIANTITMAMAYPFMPPNYELALYICNMIFSIIFFLELVVKWFGMGPKAYFLVAWNYLDFAVVVVWMVEVGLQIANVDQNSGISVLRAFRLLRVLRLVKFSPTLRKLAATVASSLGALSNLTLILVIVMYVFSVMGMQIFGADYVPDRFPDGEVPRYNFRDFQHSFMIVFRILCGEWTEPMWETMLAAGYGSVAYYLIALVVGNFIILNLFLALLLSAFEDEEAAESENNREEATKEEVEDVKEGEGVEEMSEVEVEQPPTSKPGRRRTFVRRLFSRNAIFGPSTNKVAPKVDDKTVEKGPVGVKEKEGRHAAKERERGEELIVPSDDASTIMEPTESTTAAQANSSSSNSNSNRNSKSKSKSNNIDGNSIETLGAKTAKETPYQEADRLFGAAPRGLWLGFRRYCYLLATNWIFDSLILIVIVWSSIMLCFEDSYLRFKPDLELLLFQFNIFFVALFTFEFLVKVLGMGLRKYFLDGWNLLDFGIVIIGLVAVALHGSNVGAVRSLRTLRALRPLRAVSRWESMRITVNSLLNSIPAISNVLLICGLFWLIFAILGVQFFGGTFHRCVDAEGERYAIDMVNNKSQCLALGEVNPGDYEWINSAINLDNTGNAFMALFQVATFEGWMEVMADSVDARGLNLQPEFEANFAAYYFYVAFILVGSFFALNLFIGVIISNFSRLKLMYEDEARGVFMTAGQKRFMDTLQRTMRRRPAKHVNEPSNAVRRFCFRLANHPSLEPVIMVVIGLNMITFTFDHYQMSDTWILVQLILNLVFTGIYTLEAAVKLLGWGREYFRSNWNNFDFAIVIVSWVGIIIDFVAAGIGINLSILRVLRVLRVVRILRVLKFAKGVQTLLLTLIYSAPSLINIASLLFLVMFIFAVIGMQLFGNVIENGALDEMFNFKDFGGSMLILFRLLTSAGWNDVLESCMVQPPDCDPNWEGLDGGNCGDPTGAQVYFGIFTLVSFLILVNMYIAVILDNLAMQQAKRGLTLSDSDFEAFYEHWKRFDPTATQFISQADLLSFVAVLEAPLGIPDAHYDDLTALNLPIYSGGLVHCADVLKTLVRRNMLLRSSMEHDELKREEVELVEKTLDSRFKRAFPLRDAAEEETTTAELLQRSKAALLIQRFYRQHKESRRAQMIHDDSNALRRLQRREHNYFEERML